MTDFPQPVVVVSKCLGFAKCRWNGISLPDPFVDMLEPFVEYRPVCPEADVGLGIPRPPIRIVEKKGEKRLIQPETGRDITDTMLNFTKEFLDAQGDDPDGFLLKFRSPTCGMYNVKKYPRAEKCAASGTTRGFFGGAVLDRYGRLAVEDEGRVKNFRIREHYLTRLFLFARFRRVAASGKMKGLVRFHAQNKFLLMAYNQTRMRALGRICANPDKRPAGEAIAAYREELHRAVERAPRFTSNINVLMHALGFFSKKISAREKAYFLETLEDYRAEKLPLSVPVGVIRSWIIRFDEDYLADQSFFEPYPKELVEIKDSGKGRKIKK